MIMYDFIVTTMSYILQLELLPVKTQTKVLDGLQEYIKDRRVELEAINAAATKVVDATADHNV